MRPSPFKPRGETLVAAVDRTVRVAKPAPKDQPPPRDGLEWLAAKKKLNARQLKEARRYRDAFRDAGELSMKSCLDIQEGGRGTAGPGQYLEVGVLTMTQARRDLFVMRFAVLRGQAEVLTVMDGVCGVGWTPRDLAGGDKHKARDLEVVLGVALDLLVAYRAEQEALAAASSTRA
jgi:hypothetical protein